MVAGETLLVVSIKGNVKLVLRSHSLQESLNVVHATDLSHGLGGIVGVATSSVPVTEELGLEAHRDTEVLSNTSHQVSGNPDLVTNLDSEARADLELPLTWHNLGICSRNLDLSEEASLVVSIDDGATVADVGTNRAVVRSLGAWVARRRPAEGLNCEVVLGLKK